MASSGWRRRSCRSDGGVASVGGRWRFVAFVSPSNLAIGRLNFSIELGDRIFASPLSPRRDFTGICQKKLSRWRAELLRRRSGWPVRNIADFRLPLRRRRSSALKSRRKRFCPIAPRSIQSPNSIPQFNRPIAQSRDVTSKSVERRTAASRLSTLNSQPFLNLFFFLASRRRV